MGVLRRGVLYAVGSALSAGTLATFHCQNEGKQAGSPSSETAMADDSYYVDPTEDVAGIQRVIDDHGPNVTVQLGSGEYTGSGLTLDDGVHLRGLGRNATTVRLADDADADLVVTPDVNRESVSQPLFRNVTFDGNRENNSAGDVVYGAFWNGRFVDCDFVSAANNGFWLAGSDGASTDDNSFRGCRFIDCAGDGLKQGLNRTDGPALGVSRVESCWFGGNGGRAVRVRGNGNIVANCKFYDNRGIDVFVDRGTRNMVLNNDLAKSTAENPCVAVRAGAASTRRRIACTVTSSTAAFATPCTVSRMGTPSSGYRCTTTT
ncbi:right-handed parallel beta-helix repeat-containing protein [Halobacteriaceae archaeon GCM10025711]